ncbi:MAG: PIN domain-containing protein [Actinomycetota bacterium]|nr:PIN domain-containing protein [Actinomycetota bacterium]
MLAEKGRLRSWSRIVQPVSNELTRLECLRTIDRARVPLGLADRVVARHRADVLEALSAFHLVSLDERVLERASEPFPTLLGSLDAIHLASGLLARSAFEQLAFATHDQELAVAATAVGFEVLS